MTALYQCRYIRAARVATVSTREGHSHENPISMNPDQEEAVLVKSIELIQKFSGKRPTG
jgi:hypothetical protein